MLLETLQSKTGKLWIGIEHILNSSTLNREQILNLLQKESNLKAAQFVNCELVVDSHHILSAAQNALNAWEGGYAASRSLSVEIILFASGQKQISNALENLGIGKKPESVLIVVVGDDKLDIKEFVDGLVSSIGERKKPMFQTSKSKMDLIMEFFDVEEKEILAISETESIEDQWNALSRCVSSRVSMVSFDL